MKYFFYRLGAWLLFYTHEAIGYPLFGLAGLLAYALKKGTRDLVADNMRIVLGPTADEREVQRLTREAFRNLAWNYYELFHMPAFHKESIQRRMDIVGLEYLMAAIAQGKGVLLTGAHFGNSEVLMQIPVFFDLKFVLLVEKMADERLFGLLSRLRASQGMEMVAADEPLKIIRRLKQGCVVGIAVDRDVTRSGIVVNFFQRPARLPDGAVRLAMRTGAPLVPAFGWRARSGRFQIRILPPIELVSTGNFEHDVCVNMRKLLQVLEQFIRERPGQWMAFHHVWV